MMMMMYVLISIFALYFQILARLYLMFVAAENIFI